MDKYAFDFRDSRLDAGSAARCVLNVVIGTESFSLLATEKTGEIRALQTQHFPRTGRDFRDIETYLRTAVGSEALLTFHFGAVHCAFFNLNATLVPRRLFDAQDLQAYFKLLLQPSEYEYAYDELPALDCSVVYAVEPVVTRMCGQYFPGAANMHQATPLLKAWHHAAPAGDYAVFVNVRNQAGQVAVFDRKNLLFYNAFGFVKPNDLLYFVLLAYDQFRLSPAEVPLTIGGNLAEDTEAFRLLHRYIDTIRFAALPDSVVLPEETDHLPAHYWHDLFAVAQSQLPHF